MALKQKILLLIVICITALLLFYAFLPNTQNTLTDSTTIKVGALVMLSGDLSNIGQEMQRGIDIAVNEINTNGGINGKKVVVLYEDIGIIDKAKIVTATHKLISVDKVDFLLMDTVEAVKPVASIIQESKTPTLVLWDDNNYLRSVGAYLIGVGFSTEKTGEKIANFAYFDKNSRNVAIVLCVDDWSDITASSFKKQFELNGGRISSYDRTLIEENDFRAIIRKSVDANVDAFFIPIFSTQVNDFMKQIKELGVVTPVFGADSFNDIILKSLGDKAEGVYFTNVYVTNNQQLTSLLTKYKQIYSQDPSLKVFVSIGYDGLTIVKTAVEESNNTSKESNLAALYAIQDLPLSNGLNLSMRKDRENSRPEMLYVVTNGNVIPLE